MPMNPNLLEIAKLRRQLKELAAERDAALEEIQKLRASPAKVEKHPNVRTPIDTAPRVH